MPLGAQKAQRAHVAVEDVDGLQPAVETVPLHIRDVAVILLLLQAWPVPEDEHLLVSNDQVPAPVVLLSKVSRDIEVRQEVANVAQELVLGVGVLAGGPAIGQHDDERAVLREAARKHGLAWDPVARGEQEGRFCAHFFVFLLQPRALEETHGRFVPALHAQLGEFFKVDERLLVKHLGRVGVPHYQPTGGGGPGQRSALCE